MFRVRLRFSILAWSNTFDFVSSPTIVDYLNIVHEEFRGVLFSQCWGQPYMFVTIVKQLYCLIRWTFSVCKGKEILYPFFAACFCGLKILYKYFMLEEYHNVSCG